MAEDNLKNFTVATVFIFICSVSLLYFALGYPALNNQQSVLIENPAFNQTAQDLAASLGEYQTTQNVRVNLSSIDDPQTTAEGVILGTTTANVRSTMSELTSTFVVITGLLGNVFGLSGGQFSFIAGALLSLFSIVILYYLIKMIRYGL